MKFTVDWAQMAVANLASLWMLAPDPQAVTLAQDKIDKLLASDPLAHGFHMSEGLNAIDVPPLRALFEVDSQSRTVTVEVVHLLPWISEADSI